MKARLQALEILPGKGFGPLRFGMTIGDVSQILGRPEQGSVLDLFDEWSLVLRFRGLDLFFDQSEDFRLSSVEANERSNCILFGEILVPSHPSQASRSPSKGARTAEGVEIQETRNEDLEEVALRIPSIGITFYLNLKGKLQGWGGLCTLPRRRRISFDQGSRFHRKDLCGLHGWTYNRLSHRYRIR